MSKKTNITGGDKAEHLRAPSEPIIQPLIRVDGQKHALEKLWVEDEAPELKAIGYAKIFKDRQHSWVSYIITTQGDQVKKIEISEPDMREIAEESSKIDFVNSFVDVLA